MSKEASSSPSPSNNNNNLQSETDSWLNAHRDHQRSVSAGSPRRSLTSSPIKRRRSSTLDSSSHSDSITSINMAGEIQKLPMDNSESSTTINTNNNTEIITNKQCEQEEKKEEEELSASEIPDSAASKDDKPDDGNQEQPQESNDQTDSYAVDQPAEAQTSPEADTKDDQENSPPAEAAAADDDQADQLQVEESNTSFDSEASESAPLISPTAASAPQESSLPHVETVTSVDSLDLRQVKTNSNAEIIEDAQLSKTLVDSGEQDVSSENNPESRPSLAARAAAAATGILPSLSNLSASPRTSPRTSPRFSASPTRSPTTTTTDDEKPSLAARAAAAAAAAAEVTGINTVLSNMSGSVSNTPRVSPSRSATGGDTSPISAARTWPDMDQAGVGEDTFLDNGQPVQRPAPSPPSSDVGVGGRVPQFKFPKIAIASKHVNDSAAAATTSTPEEEDTKSNESSPLLAAENDPATTTTDEAGGADTEAQVLSVVPTVIETDDFEDKEDDIEEQNREVVPLSPKEESAHEFNELDDAPPSRSALCLAFLKTKKGIAMVVVFFLLVLGIGLGVGLSSKPDPSFCEAAKLGYSIPGEGNYKQLDFNWMVDVSTTSQWDRSFLIEINQDFQSKIIPTIAGCEGGVLTTDESRIVNGYAVTARDTGDCSAGATRPCFRLLFDFALWVKDEYQNSLNMEEYLNDNFGELVQEEIMSKSVVNNAKLVSLQKVQH